MQFEKLDRLLEKAEQRSRLLNDYKPLKKSNYFTIQEGDDSYFNSPNPLVMTSTLVLKSQIESFISDRKIMGKSKRRPPVN